MRRRHAAASSYRLQLNASLRFSDAHRLVPYLDSLGITDCYASPVLTATPGSTHGYDISDHNTLNPELGTEHEFIELASSLAGRQMGLLLDFVPNHMGLDERANAWWRDVLQHGPDSPFANFFDIDWRVSPGHPRGRVLLPILEDSYGDVLDRGEIELVYENGVPVISYFDHRLPIAEHTLDRTAAPSTGEDLNGIPGDAASWDRLHDVLERQWYRLAHWKTSIDEINYRRFFDVNHLGGLRMELPEVFEATHRKVLSLVEAGHVTGLRLDHPDGLLDPEEYVRRLRRSIDALPAAPSQGAPYFPLLVEKILARGELLPAAWPVEGTTGYGFMNDVNGVFVDASQGEALRQIYHIVSGRRESFAEVSYRSRRLVTRSSMASELTVLTQRLKGVADADRKTRDFTAATLSRAISEVASCMPVYRTYVSRAGFSAIDRETIDVAIDRARRFNPVMSPAVFLFLRQVLLAEGDAEDAGVIAKRDFAMRFQQFTAPIQAKGIEDTAFYRYVALTSLNEVGGDPSQFGCAVDEFHAANGVRRERWPHEMTSTATHDTKRGEDARARINVLSEMSAEWEQAVARWRLLNTIRKTAVDREPAPDANDEYLLYQVLIGSWPAEPADAEIPPEAPAAFADRVKAFMLKAVREAKTHTSWLNQNGAYEDAVALFVETILRGSTAAAFMSAFVPLARQIARAGMVNSLAQLVLKVASPGVPDFYQGTELWQLDLADPDNRRPVDFACRQSMLATLESRIEQVSQVDRQPSGLSQWIADLVAHWEDDRIKMFITAAALRRRRLWADVFIDGSYMPLRTSGSGAPHVIAFARQYEDRTVMAIVPRLLTTLARGARTAGSGDLWSDTRVELPAGLAHRLQNVLTGEIHEPAPSLSPGRVFQVCPVALLVNV